MLRTFCVLLSLQWVSRLDLASAQNLPPIACPNYFQYVNYGGQIVGKITLLIAHGETRLDVQFSQLEPAPTNFAGELSLFQDDKTTTNNIERGVPVSYRVVFPTPNELPKLTRIDVNGETICSASPQPGAPTTLNLHHMLRTSGTVPLLGGYNPIQPNVYSPINVASNTVRPSPDTFVIYPSPSPDTFVIYPSPNPNSNNPFLQPRPPLQPGAAKPIVQRLSPMPQSSNAVCGEEGNVASPFIYGGSLIQRGQFPWMTAIYQKVSAGLKFICSGSLISSRTVLTAGHCFKLYNLSASQVVVYFGRYNLDNYNEDGVVTRTPQTVIVNPEYSSNRFPDADLAILQFSSPVEFTQYIGPICLWSESTDISLIVGKSGVVAGWGENENERSLSPLPKSVDAKIVDEVDCLRSSIVFNKLTSPRTLCAGNRNGEGPCHGDSGSGLMMKRGGRWMLRGIVSVGQTKQNKCNLNEYVVYCDVAKHLSWVRSNMLP